MFSELYKSLRGNFDICFEFIPCLGPASGNSDTHHVVGFISVCLSVTLQVINFFESKLCKKSNLWIFILFTANSVNILPWK